MFCSVECAHILVITTSGAADKRRHLAPCTSPSQETQVLEVNKATNQLTLSGITVIIRLNLVKIRFSQNAFFIFFFTGGAFIVVKYNIKLVLEF